MKKTLILLFALVLCGGYGFCRNNYKQLDVVASFNFPVDSPVFKITTNSSTRNATSGTSATNINAKTSSNKAIGGAKANTENQNEKQAEDVEEPQPQPVVTDGNKELREKIITPQKDISKFVSFSKYLGESGLYIVTNPVNNDKRDYFIHLDTKTFSNLKKVVQDTFLLDKLANDTSFVKNLETLSNEMIDENGEFISPYGNNDSSVPVWLYIAMAVMFIALVAFIVIFVKDRNNRREEIIKEVSGSDRIKKFVADEAGKVAKNAQPAPQSRSYDGDIRELQSRVATLEDANNKKQVEETKSPIVQQKPQQQQNRKLYAQTILNGKLMRVSDTPNDETIFELVLKGDSKATLTLYRQAYEKIKADTSFLEGCEKSVLGRDSIVIKNEGEAVKDENDNWCVTRNLNVTLK